METTKFFSSYRENLIRAIERLDKCEELLSEAAFNVMMNGEFAELNQLFEIGDTFNFPDDGFEISEDVNVKVIMSALYKVQEAIQSIQNLNSIKDQEVSWGEWKD